MTGLEVVSAEVCPYAQRTRMALIEKGLDFALTEVDLDNKPEWFVRLSPYGKVPVLRHGEKVVWESSVINEYLEETFPEPPLMPRDAYRRALARIWIEYGNGKFLPVYYKFLMAQEVKEQAEWRRTLEEQLRFMENEGLRKLGGAGPFWMGQELTLADLSYYPFFERLPVWRHYRDFDLPKECGRLREWLAFMRERDSAKATGHDADYYIPRYAHYARGEARGTSARNFKMGLVN